MKIIKALVYLHHTELDIACNLFIRFFCNMGTTDLFFFSFFFYIKAHPYTGHHITGSMSIKSTCCILLPVTKRLMLLGHKEGIKHSG